MQGVLIEERIATQAFLAYLPKTNGQVAVRSCNEFKP